MPDAMENVLLKYMIECFNKAGDKTLTEQLPFITISRLHGCHANYVSDMLVKKLNNRPDANNKKQPWHWISKEILETAARELNIDKERILRIYRNEWHGFIEETMESFLAKHYKHDTIILKTIDRVIRDFASMGNVIILGRGGFEVTRKMGHGFHVFLTAPVEWRAHRVMVMENFKTKVEALNHTRQVDAQRYALKNKLGGIPTDESAYNVIYNCDGLSPECITDSIIFLMKSKGLLP
jgi:cytidylate kinase